MISGLILQNSFLPTYNSSMVKLQIIRNCVLTPPNVRLLLTRPFTDKESPVPYDNTIQHFCEIITALDVTVFHY